MVTCSVKICEVSVVKCEAVKRLGTLSDVVMGDAVKCNQPTWAFTADLLEAIASRFEAIDT